MFSAPFPLLLDGLLDASGGEGARIGNAQHPVAVWPLDPSAETDAPPETIFDFDKSATFVRGCPVKNNVDIFLRRRRICGVPVIGHWVSPVSRPCNGQPPLIHHSRFPW